jgi:selenocysteine-specific elongation factor
MVLDPMPPRRGATWESDLASGDPSKRLEVLVKRRRWGLDPRELPLLLGVSPSQTDAIVRNARGVTRLAELLIPAALKQDLKSRMVQVVSAWHVEKPLEPGIPLSALRQALGRSATHLAPALIGELTKAGTLRQEEGVVALPGFRPTRAGTQAEVDGLVARLGAAGLAAPTVGELEQETGQANLLRVLRQAATDGRLVAVTGDWFLTPEALERFVAELETLGAQGDITPPALRERLGLTRKYLIPLLEWADSRGHTRREGDHRVLVRHR